MFVFLFLPYVGGAVAIYDPAQSIPIIALLQYFLMAAKRNQVLLPKICGAENERGEESKWRVESRTESKAILL